MSGVWNHFEKIDSDRARCRFKACQKTYSCKGGSTKGLWDHYKLHQNSDKLPNEPSTSQAHNKTQKRKAEDTTEPHKHQKSQPKIDDFIRKPTLEETLSKFAAKDGFSFHSIVNSEGLKDYIKLKGWSMPKSCSTVTKLIEKFYESKKVEIKTKLKQILSDGGMFSISLDEWSDCQMRKYLNITLHAENEDIVLGLLPVIGSCDAFKTRDLVKKFLNDFDLRLDDDIVASCNDGAAVMVKYGKLNKTLAQLCYNHSIHNSVIKVFYKKTTKQNKETEEFLEDEEENEDEDSDSEEELEEKGQKVFFTDLDAGEDEYEEEESLRDVLEETRKTVKFFKYSCTRKSILQKNVLKSKDKILNLLLDCKTRWKSTYIMTVRFALLKNEINESLKELGQTQLSDEHFQKLETMNRILRPAALVINELSKKDSNLLTAEGSISFLFEELSIIPHPLAAELINELQDKLLSRRNKQVVSLLYFLHNGVYAKKTKYLDYSSKDETKTFGEKLYGKLFQKQDQAEEPVSSESEGEEASEPANKLKESINRVLNVKKNQKPRTLKAEFVLFENGSQRSMRMEKLYRALITIKPTSTASERSFSVSGLICTKIRNRMSPKMLHILVFLRYYFLSQSKN